MNTEPLCPTEGSNRTLSKTNIIATWINDRHGDNTVALKCCSKTFFQDQVKRQSRCCHSDEEKQSLPTQKIETKKRVCEKKVTSNIIATIVYIEANHSQQHRQMNEDKQKTKNITEHE